MTHLPGMRFHVKTVRFVQKFTYFYFLSITQIFYDSIDTVLWSSRKNKQQP